MSLFKKKFFTKRFRLSLFALHSSLKQINPSPPPRRGNRAFTLAEGATHVAMSKNIRKCAFTLAEVLITLGIIGVVAALTLPTLIANYKKQTYVNQLKKVINTLENGMRMAVVEEEVSSFKETKVYSRLIDMYSCEPNCSDVVKDIAKYFNLKYVSIDTSEKDYSSNYKNFDDSNDSLWMGDFKHPMVMPDGSIIYLTVFLKVDVNGNKGPNQMGKDTFKLYLLNEVGTAKPGVIRWDFVDCSWIDPADYLQRGCYYSKILYDGWKMNY